MLSTAKQSPRLSDGTIYWYEGDTFCIALVIRLKNCISQEPIPFFPQDVVSVAFQSQDGNLIHEFIFSEIGENGRVILNFDKDISSKFSKGYYQYSIKKNGKYVRTLCHKNYAEVE